MTETTPSDSTESDQTGRAIVCFRVHGFVDTRPYPNMDWECDRPDDARWSDRLTLDGERDEVLELAHEETGEWSAEIEARIRKAVTVTDGESEVAIIDRAAAQLEFDQFHLLTVEAQSLTDVTENVDVRTASYADPTEVPDNDPTLHYDPVLEPHADEEYLF